MERAGMGRMAHKITSKEKEKLFAAVGRLKQADVRTKRSVVSAEVVLSSDIQKQAPQKIAANGSADVLQFPNEFYNFFNVEEEAS